MMTFKDDSGSAVWRRPPPCLHRKYLWYHMTIAIANIYSLHNDLDCHVETATAKHWYNGSDWVETIDKGQVHSAFRHAKDRGQSSRQQKTPKRDGIFSPFFDMQRTLPKQGNGWLSVGWNNQKYHISEFRTRQNSNIITVFIQMNKPWAKRIE